MNSWFPSIKFLLIHAKRKWVCLIGYKITKNSNEIQNDTKFNHYWNILNSLSPIVSIKYYEGNCFIIMGVIHKMKKYAISEAKMLKKNVDKIEQDKIPHNLTISNLPGYSIEEIWKNSNITIQNDDIIKIKYNNEVFYQKLLLIHSIECKGSFSKVLNKLNHLKGVSMLIGSENSKMKQYLSFIINSKSISGLKNKQNEVIKLLCKDSSIRGKMEVGKTKDIMKNPGKFSFGIHSKKIDEKKISKIISSIPECLVRPRIGNPKNVYPWLGFNKKPNHKKNIDKDLIGATIHNFGIKEIDREEYEPEIKNQSNLVSKSYNNSCDNKIAFDSISVSQLVPQNQKSVIKKTILETFMENLDNMGLVNYTVEEISDFNCHKIWFVRKKLTVEFYIYQELPINPPDILIDRFPFNNIQKNRVVGVIYKGSCPESWKNRSWDLINLSGLQDFLQQSI